jgi:hypothetical protein
MTPETRLAAAANLVRRRRKHRPVGAGVNNAAPRSKDASSAEQVPKSAAEGAGRAWAIQRRRIFLSE